MSLNGESVQQINITKPITKMDMSVVFSSQKAILLYFHTDSKLVLNITFFDLHFYAGLENCILEKFSVINLKTEKTSYEYCGHVPTFNLYPEFNDVMIRIKLAVRLPFDINALFSVSNYKKADLCSAFLLSSETKARDGFYRGINKYTLVGWYSVVSLLVRVNRLFRVKIKVQSQSLRYVAYDDPGFTSNILKEIRNVYIASSFQCILQIEMDFIPKKQRYGFAIYMQEHARKGRLIIRPGSSSQFSTTNKDCGNQVCLILMETNPGFHVNLTVLKIVSDYKYHSDCLYGGLYIAEGDKNIENDVMCGDSNHLKEPIRSFYSVGNSLQYLLYGYTGHSEISSRIRISTTKCKAMRIDPFQFHASCTDRCYDPYLMIVDNDFLELKNKGGYNELHVDVRFERECFILQLGNWHFGNITSVFPALTSTLTLIYNDDKQTYHEVKIRHLRGSLNILRQNDSSSNITLTGLSSCSSTAAGCVFKFHEIEIPRIITITEAKIIDYSIVEKFKVIKAMLISLFRSKLKYDWIDIHFIFYSNPRPVHIGISVHPLKGEKVIDQYSGKIFAAVEEFGSYLILSVNASKDNIKELNHCHLVMKINSFIKLKFPYVWEAISSGEYSMN